DRVRLELGKRVESERLELPGRPDPAFDPVATVERYERIGPGGARSVEVRARLPPQMQEMLESRSRHEGGARSLPLEQRVGRHGRPVREALDLVRANLACGR